MCVTIIMRQMLVVECGHATQQVRGFVRPSVVPSVRPSIRKHESKSGKTYVLEAFSVCVSVGKGVGVGWDVVCGMSLVIR